MEVPCPLLIQLWGVGWCLCFSPHSLQLQVPGLRGAALTHLSWPRHPEEHHLQAQCKFPMSRMELSPLMGRGGGDGREKHDWGEGAEAGSELC